MSTENLRHLDRRPALDRFAGRILVACPRCGGQALVVPRPGLPPLRYYTELLYRPRRLTCAGCGAAAEWRAELRDAGLVGVVLGGTREPFFGRPLWLQTRCAGRILWAYNEDHVAALADYVGARLREHVAGSPTRAMFPRLPRWIKSSARRAEVLAGLEKLRRLSDRSTPADRSDAAYEHGDTPRPHTSLFFRGGHY